jgi:hypothetical protein
MAVPLVDVAKTVTEYVPGGRPKSALYAVALPPAATLVSVAVEYATVCPCALCITAKTIAVTGALDVFVNEVWTYLLGPMVVEVELPAVRQFVVLHVVTDVELTKNVGGIASAVVVGLPVACNWMV